MAEFQKYSLVQELNARDETLMNSPSLYGISMLTFPRYINAMRAVMFTGHNKQSLVPCNPDMPYVFTGEEKSVGDNSTGYRKTKTKLTVYRKVEKFKDLLDHPRYYQLFVYDPKEDMYDVIERKELEDLTETFGFNYNNQEIDKYEEGDTIKKGTILDKSTSYDKDMLFGYGQNVVTMYTLDPYTSEDAAVISRSFSKRFTTIETEEVEIKLNDNDFMLNLYGDEYDYKPLPEIGEHCNGILGAIRTQFNNQILYDFKNENLRRRQASDRTIFVNGKYEIVDYEIFSNADEIVDTEFNRQINHYLRSQIEYYQEIYDICTEIKKSGSKFSQNIRYLRKRAKDMLDTESKWKEGDAAFSDMVIKVTIRRERELSSGQKITGRYGNKSVISEIREDEDMPFTEDGRRVDLLINLLAIINRTTAFAIYELCITSICWQTRQRMKAMETIEDKENLLFEMIGMFNEVQRDKLLKTYEKKNDSEKNEIIQDAIDNGIYIHISPIKETIPLWYRINNILEKYDWLKPSTVYIKSHGHIVKTMSKHWIGEMYIMKLKQTDLRGFSARSTGAIDIKGLPTRSYKSRNHTDKFSDSAIRFGEFETLNLSIGIPTEDIAAFHALYRTSIKGREDLVKSIFKFNGKTIEPESNELMIDDGYTNRAAEIFNVFFKSMGLRINFVDEDHTLQGFDNHTISLHELDGETILCTDYEFMMRKRRKELREDVLHETAYMATTEWVDKEVERRLKEDGFVIGDIVE